MIELTISDVAGAVGGSLRDGAEPHARVSDVVIDSRRAHPGALFVALRGERADGHVHAAEAVAAGATCVLAARQVGVPAVVVDDTLLALGRLARGVRDRLPDIAAVGLTGSSGKTTTKDLLAHVLETAGPTIAPVGSYNNEIGVPLTVLAADHATRHLVIEMGARGRGHISYLCTIARPAFGLVLNVGAAHVGEFGSLEAVAVAKRELVEALPPAADGGVAFLNADDPAVRGMGGFTRARIVTFGTAPDADVRADNVVLDEVARAAFDLRTNAGDASVHLRLHGAHNVSNALAAAAAAIELGVPVGKVASALSDASARSRWRMEVTERPDGVTIVNDAYNANPASVRAALEALAVMGGATRRTWAVLGEMLELGAASADEHAAIGRLAVRRGVSRLVVVGQGARPAFTAAREHATGSREEAVFVADAEAASALLREQVRPGDVVLVKASRRAGLEKVAAELLVAQR